VGYPYGVEEELSHCLNRGDDVNVQDEHGRTPLHAAHAPPFLPGFFRVDNGSTTQRCAGISASQRLLAAVRSRTSAATDTFRKSPFVSSAKPA